MPLSSSAATVDRWFSQPYVSDLLAQEQAELIPQLTAQIGVRGLYLRPAAAVPRELSGNMLQSLTTLHLTPQAWAGDVRCAGAPLPLGSECFSLVYLLHVLEQSDDPAALLREAARCLQPEGLLVILVFNPWSPFRLRWPSSGLSMMPPRSIERWVEQVGLSVEQHRGIGCLWRAPTAAQGESRRLRPMLAPWLSSRAIIARKRRAAPSMVGPAGARLRARATLS